ncbi:ABC transporter permease [Nocardioides cynanchi]|uniref:ABC transporter permease n=1 Tax=Nocardioides cynanchi TaxID=2558918 RepID=UPI0012483EE9|nr:FtsX-like permease family protein [Nocardioides cynanchi]
MLRATWKSLLARKVRLLMSTFAIALGVAFVVGSLVFSAALSAGFNRLFGASVGDVVVRPAGATTLNGDPSTRTVPASLVDRLAQVPGAARADGNVQALGVFVISVDGKVVGGLGAPTYGISYSTAPAEHGVPGLALLGGHAPHGPHQIALDEHTAGAGGYHLGDQVHVVTAGRKAVLSERLVGIVGYADNTSLAGATLTVFDVPTAQRLFLHGKDAFTNIWVTADHGVSQTSLRSAVVQALPPQVKAVTGEDAANESASGVLRGVSFLRTFLLIFAGVALVVGAYLIVNTFSILVAQRSRELALLRAIGASRRQVSRSVLLEALVLGLFGSTVGLALGVGLAYAIRSLIGLIGLDLGSQSLTLTGEAVVAGYGTGVVVTMAAAWLPARRTTRITPVQALGDVVALPESSIRWRFALGMLLAVAGAGAALAGLFATVPHSGYWVGGGILAVLLGVTAAAPILCRPLLAAARWAYAGMFRAVGNLAGQNALRNPRRTTATASALMIGLALACTMSIIGASAKASVDQAISENFIGNYVVGSGFGQPFSSQVATRIAHVPGVTKVVRQRYAFIEADGKREALTGVDPRQIDDFGLHLSAGTTGLAGRTVLVNQKYADRRHVAVGDTVRIGKLPVGTRTFRVGGIYADTPLVFDFVVSIDNLRRAGFEDSDNFLIVFTRHQSAATLSRLQHQVRSLPVVTVQDETAFAQQQRAPIDRLVLMVDALLGLALVIAVLGIVNTLALSIIERTREIGLLRAIGLGRGQLRLMVTLESVVMAVLGAVLGVALGVCFGVAMMYAVRDQGLKVIAIPWAQLAVFLGLAVVIGVVAAVLPARRAARLDVLAAISAT